MKFKYGITSNNDLFLIIDNDVILHWYITNIVLADHEKSAINIICDNIQHSSLSKLKFIDEIVSAKLKIITSIYKKYKKVIINKSTGICTPTVFSKEFESSKYLY